MPHVIWALAVQSRKFPENSFIMKWQPAYDIYKLFDKAVDTIYAEPKWKATYVSTVR